MADGAGVESRINLHTLPWGQACESRFGDPRTLTHLYPKNGAYFIVNTEKKPVGLYVSSLLVTRVAMDSEYCKVFDLLNVINGSDGPDSPLTLCASCYVTNYAKN